MSAKSCQAYSLLKLTELIWKVLVLPVGFNKNWFQTKHFFAISCFSLICISDPSDWKQSNNTFTYSISTFAFLFYRRKLIPNVFDKVLLCCFHFFKCNVFKRTLTVSHYVISLVGSESKDDWPRCQFQICEPKALSLMSHNLCVQT